MASQVLDIPPFYAKSARALQAAAPSLVFVNVSWCKYCKEARPVLDKVASALGWNVPVYSLDADKNPDVAKELGVASYPTIFFASNDGFRKFEGERTYDQLIGFVCESSTSNAYSFCPAENAVVKK